MKIDRIENSKQGILFGLLNRIVSTIFPFAVRTIIIKELGADYLGLNSLFSSILQVLSLTELGVSNAIVFSMYRPIVEDDKITICALLAYYRKFYKIVGITISFVGILILPILPNLIKDGYPQDINIYILFYIYVINTSISYFLYAYRQSILQAFQRNDLISKINSFVLIFQYSSQLVILLLLKNYYYYAFTLPIFTAMNSFIILFVTKKKYPDLICYGKLAEVQKKELKKNVEGIILSKICFTLRNGLDSVILSAFLGLTTVAIYNNYYYIINALLGIFVVIVNSITAGIGNSVVSESVEKNYNDMCRITFLYSWLAGLCTVCLVCLYQPFMQLWVGKELLLDMPIVIFFCAYFYINTMGHIRGMYQDAVGLWWEARYRAISETIMNLILNIVLVRTIGVLGVILASCITMLIINFGFGTNIVFKQYFKKYSVIGYFIQYCGYLIVCVSSSFIIYKICNLITLDSLLITLFVRLGICVVIYNSLYYMIFRRYQWFLRSKPLINAFLYLKRNI